MAQRAIDCCSKLSRWALAIDLAREHDMQVENLLESRAQQLRQHGRKVDEVNLFKRAEVHHRSAQVLVEMAKNAVVCCCLVCPDTVCAVSATMVLCL